MAPGAALGLEGHRDGDHVGGFWQITDFKSESMGQPFEVGDDGLDPAKQEVRGDLDRLDDPRLRHGRGNRDAAKKTMTAFMEGPDPPARS